MANVISAANDTDTHYLHSGFSSTITSSYGSPSTTPFGISWDGNNVISADGGTDTHYLHVGFSSTITSSYTSPSNTPQGITWDGSNVISSGHNPTEHYLHSGFSSTVLDSYVSPSLVPTGITWDGSNVIAADSYSDLHYLHSGFSSTITGSYSSPSASTYGITWDGSNVISADITTDLHFLHSGFTSTISDSYASSNPTGITWDGRYAAATPDELTNASFDVTIGFGTASVSLDELTAVALDVPVGFGTASVGEPNVISATRAARLHHLHAGFTSTVSDSYVPPGTGPRGISWDGTNVISADDVSDLHYLHDGFSSTIASSYSSPGVVPYGISWDGSSVISSDVNAATHYLHSGFSSTIASSHSSPNINPYGITWDGSNAISGDYSTDTHYLHSGFSSTVSDSYASPSTLPTGISWDGTNVISSDYDSNTHYLHSGFSSSISSSYPSPSTTPDGITWDGRYATGWTYYELTHAPLDVTIAFGVADLSNLLIASVLDVPVAFGSAEVEVQLTNDAPLDIPVGFGTASVAVAGELMAVAIDVPIVFGAGTLETQLGATPLDVPVAFGAADFFNLLIASALDVDVAFGGAQAREIRTGTGGGIPLAIQEPLELRSADATFAALLPRAASVRIRQKINSLDVLSFDYPRRDDRFEDISEGTLIRFRGQDYRVVDVDDARGANGLSGTVTAEQHFIALGDTLIQSVELEGVRASAAMSTALAGTGWSVGTVDAATGEYSVSKQWASPLAVLFQIANMWNGELLFGTNEMTVSLLAERGADLGASLIYRKNIAGLERKRSATELYNRVYFEGKDGLTSLRGYVQDAVSIAAHGRRDYRWSDNTITSLPTLLYGAGLRLEAYREPRTTYSADAHNIEPVEGGASWVTAELGDRVRVYDHELGIDVSTRVYEREWAPYEPQTPDRLVLSSDREWFPDLSERLAEIVEAPPDPPDKPMPGEGAYRGEGGFAWMNAIGVSAEWKGSGKPHIWTSYWSDGDAGLPHLASDGKWHSGYDTDDDGVQDSGPLGTGATWEEATWEPHGFDLDADGIEDFWPFSSGVDPDTGAPMYGQPGGHCYNFDEAPEIWDYAAGDVPYKAVDTIPSSLWYDVTAYSWFGYDRNANGVPDSWDVIANLPCPLVFKRGELLLGIDLGGGDVEWVEANPPWIPMWHSKARADVQEIYCTGWTPAGRRNFGGPIQYFDGSWSPSPYDANDDGFDDFWAYGGWFAFGHEETEAGFSEQAVSITGGGALPSYGGPVSPGLGTAEAHLIATVLTVNGDGTVDLQIDGEVLYSVPYLTGYTPTVGDTVLYGKATDMR